ncbi:hypothetical protein D3C75_504090 [compost metagenome]
MDVVGGAEDAIRPWQVGGPRQHHEVGRAARNEQRIVRLQRDEHRAAAALGHQVEAVVEELTEEGHPRVERRGQTHVRRLVRHEKGLEGRAVGTGSSNDLRTVLQDIVNRAEDAIQTGIERGRDRRRVAGGVVGDQIADGPWLRVSHQAAGLSVRGSRFRRIELRRNQSREDRVGCTELVLTRHQVVERPVDRAQAQRQPCIRQHAEEILTGCIPFRDQNLVENELQIGPDIVHTRAGDRSLGRQRGCRWRSNAGYDRCGWSRERSLKHTILILVDGPDAQFQPGEIRGHPEGRPGYVRQCCAPVRKTGDVLKDARTRDCFELPVEGDRSSDGTAGVVGIGHVGSRYPQQLTRGRRSVRGVAGSVEDGQQAQRVVVKPDPARQGERLIVELQPLDIGQAVGAVATDDAVDHGGHAAHSGDGIVELVASEQGRIEGGGIRQDLADDDQLTGVEGAIEHERDHGLHAVEGGNLRPGSVKVLAHADAHIQPHVAVDQVVTAAAFDDVAATTAEEDVARAELIVCRAHDTVRAGCSRAKKRPQTVDEVNIGEHAAWDTGSGDRERVGIIAGQHVAERRPRQSFHLGELGMHACNRGRQGRLFEGDAGHVHSHAETIILVGGPVETGHAQHLVRALTADEDVIAAFTDHFIEAAVTAEDVVAAGQLLQQSQWQVTGEIVAGGAVLGPDLDPVVAIAAHHLSVQPAAEHEVIAGGAEDLRKVLAGDDEIVAGAAEDDIDAVAAVDDVVAGPAVDDVVAAHVGDDVIAIATLDLVIAVAAFEAIITGVAPERVVAVARDENVIAGGTAEHDMVFAGVLQVVGIGTDRRGVVANDKRCDLDPVDHHAASGIGTAIDAEPRVLQGRIDLERPGRGRED